MYTYINIHIYLYRERKIKKPQEIAIQFSTNNWTFLGDSCLLACIVFSGFIKQDNS